jgi:ubiquinone/menaquinone biosynthesis C-methylase UbiE
MPFPDNSSDAIWTVWVLEHIPEPEAALSEMRRVLKPGGVPWAADGFDVRSYSDFNWRGKLVKASIAFRRWRSRTIKFYWEPDSLVAVSLGRYEAYLWLPSRGRRLPELWRRFRAAAGVSQTQMIREFDTMIERAMVPRVRGA